MQFADNMSKAIAYLPAKHDSEMTKIKRHIYERTIEARTDIDLLAK